MKNNYFWRVILTIWIFFLIVNTYAQYSTPNEFIKLRVNDFSNIHSIKIFDPNFGIAAGNQILIFKDSIWSRMKLQPPVIIDKFYALDMDDIYIISNTEFHESLIYHWNGKQWTLINSILANPITYMTFKNDSNIVLGGYSELKISENKKWKNISLPTLGFPKSIIFQDSILWILFPQKGLYKYNKTWQKVYNDQRIIDIKKYNNSIYLIIEDAFCKIVDDSVIVINKDKRLKNIITFEITNQRIIGVGFKGLILESKGNEWKRQKSNTESNLNTITSDKTGGIWIGGENGIILYSGMKLFPEESKNIWKGFSKKTINSYAKIIDDEYGVTCADFNNDGYTDIFTCGLFEENNLYLNNRNYFNNRSIEWGVLKKNDDKFQNLNLGTTSADIDNDGDEDIYITSLNGKNTILLNQSNKKFINYSEISKGIGKANDRTNASIFGDVDNDGDLDLFITNENNTNRLYLNNGAGIFSEYTNNAGLYTKEGGMGCSFADIDNDGDLDLYVANWSKENILYKNKFIESGSLYFENITLNSHTGGDNFENSNSVVFSDINNDGFLDLFVGNKLNSNRLYINERNCIFSDSTEEYIGLDTFKTYGTVIEDFDGNGWKDIYLNNIGRNILYINNGKKLIDNSMEYNAGISGYSTGSAIGDFDNDGDVDIYISNYIGESSTILFNNLSDSSFLKIKIIGIKSNKNAIGTKLIIYNDKFLNDDKEIIDYREINGGSGYMSCNDKIQTIRIKDSKYVDIKAIFPSGIIKKLQHIKIGSTIKIIEINNFSKYYYLIRNFLFRIFKDSHNLWELIKWIFVLSLILFTNILINRKYNWNIILMLPISVFIFLIYFSQFYFMEFNSILYSTVIPLTSVIFIVFLILLSYERYYIKSQAKLEQNTIREKISSDLR
ncbi:MAG: CRTAC1 family protein [Saprospiraceae bacterium]